MRTPGVSIMKKKELILDSTISQKKGFGSLGHYY